MMLNVLFATKKIHIRCNMLDKKDHRLLRDSDNHFFMCLVCLQETIPFTELDNTDFNRLIINGDNFKYSYKNTQSTPIQPLMFDGINNWVNEQNLTDDDENFDNNNINCNYVNIVSILMLGKRNPLAFYDHGGFFTDSYRKFTEEFRIRMLFFLVTDQKYLFFRTCQFQTHLQFRFRGYFPNVVILHMVG